MSGHRTYRVETWHEEGFWVIDVPELGLTTQARRLDQIEEWARDAVSVWLEVPADSFDLRIERRLPENVVDRIHHVHELRGKIDEAKRRAADEARALARFLHDEQGMTVRDVGEIMGVSYQRAQQLIAESRGRPTRKAS